LTLSLPTKRETNSARPDMAASMAANTPSNMIDSEPDSRPNTTPNAETITVTTIDSRSILCSAAAWGMAAVYSTSSLLSPARGRGA
jgi:hypothetical protein